MSAILNLIKALLSLFSGRGEEPATGQPANKNSEPEKRPAPSTRVPAPPSPERNKNVEEENERNEKPKEDPWAGENKSDDCIH